MYVDADKPVHVNMTLHSKHLRFQVYWSFKRNERPVLVTVVSALDAIIGTAHSMPSL